MAFVVADRIKEYSNSTGIGNFLLGGVEGAFTPFSEECAVNDTFHYCIAERNGDQWEVGLGTYAAGNEVIRTSVLGSTNAGAAVNFGPGAKDIFITSPSTILNTLSWFNSSGLLGRNGSGQVQQLSPAAVKTILNISLDDIGDVISTDINNRATYSDGVFVPELTLDLVQIYNTAKT